MGWKEQRDEIIAAYAADTPVEQIQRRYGLTQDEVEYLVATGKPYEVVHRKGLQLRGNRIALGVAVGFVVQVFADLLGGDGVARVAVGALVAVVTYAAVTAAVR